MSLLKIFKSKQMIREKIFLIKKFNSRQKEGLDMIRIDLEEEDKKTKTDLPEEEDKKMKIDPEEDLDRMTEILKEEIIEETEETEIEEIDRIEDLEEISMIEKESPEEIMTTEKEEEKEDLPLTGQRLVLLNQEMKILTFLPR